eukprot:1160078-Pelagomonas_calceolata.AAC.3
MVCITRPAACTQLPICCRCCCGFSTAAGAAVAAVTIAAAPFAPHATHGGAYAALKHHQT